MKADKFSYNRKVENNLKQNDVINAKEGKQTKEHAFSHSLYTNQLQSPIDIFQISNIVNVCIRNNPNRNTIEQIITKRFRGANKKKLVI